jgi:acetyltransferase-like isoleucine patch superfamily enzyme
LPFSKAIKFPIYIYKKTKIRSLKGKITINVPIKPGLIKIGYNIDGISLSMLPVQLNIVGEIIFNGNAIISKGATISVYGELNIGNCCTIGSGSFIKTMQNISLDDNVQITYDCTIFDCDMHYVKNIETGVIKNNRAPIIIGKNCWINAGTIVSKGTVLPDYSITARNSYLNKDYSKYGTNLFLVGSPAKPLNIKVQRIFSIKEQYKLNNYFKDHSKEDILSEKGLYNEDNCEIELFFKEI